jgi:sugar/nucleoside kinase (ribokinase family)
MGESGMTFDVAVVADLCADMLFRGDVRPVYGQVEQFVDDYQIELGGSAAIFASQFTRLGGRVALHGVVGEDLLGRFLSERIAALGISTQYLSTTSRSKTPVGLGLLTHDDRAMLTYKGCLHEITIDSVQRSGVLSAARHLHIAGYYLLEELQPHWPRILSALKERGVSVSLDTNWSPLGDWDSVRALLPYVDVFLPNEGEALLISGKDDLDEAGRTLAGVTGLTAIKCGAQGALTFNATERRPFPVPQTLLEDLKIVDTTGAGDNFDAGFIFAWLQGATLADCVALGMKCATASLGAIGGIEGQLLREDSVR